MCLKGPPSLKQNWLITDLGPCIYQEITSLVLVRCTPSHVDMDDALVYLTRSSYFYKKYHNVELQLELGWRLRVVDALVYLPRQPSCKSQDPVLIPCKRDLHHLKAISL